MENLIVGVSGHVPGFAARMAYRLQAMGFESRVIDPLGRKEVDVVVFICDGWCPDGLDFLSAYSHGYEHQKEFAVTPVVIVRYELRPNFLVFGSLPVRCSDDELREAIEEAYAMVPHGADV